MWVADDSSYPLLAWDMATGDRVPERDFLLPETSGLTEKKAIWSFGRTLWVTSNAQDKVYSFNFASDETTLSELTVSPRDIIGFRPGRFSYAVGMASTVTTATVNATATDTNAAVTYSGRDADPDTAGHQIALSPGRNVVVITVTAEDGVNSQRYTLTIARGVTDTYGWKAVDDLDGLIAAGNVAPYGLWSNGTAFYLADDQTDHIYVYNRNGTRDTSKEFALDVGHFNLRGIWSDGATLWMVDYGPGEPRLFAYRLPNGSRALSEEFELAAENQSASDIWSDGDTMWVLDSVARNLFAYRLSDGERDDTKDVDISSALAPLGLWSDGVTIWVGNSAQLNLIAWDLASGERAHDRDFRIPISASLFNNAALWSDGVTMWVASANQSKVFSFNMPNDDASLSELTVQAPRT